MTVPVVETRGLTRIYRLGTTEVRALRNVDLKVGRGEFLAITGRSGAGKTTLLNLISGLDQPSEGVVLVDGQDLARFSEKEVVHLRRHRLGFIFQSFGLLPLLSAYENVELPLRIAGVKRAERDERVMECLGMVGLAKRMNHRPFELSGGEQQRVAIARALANRPGLLLADEPTGELDSANASAIFSLLREISEREGVTVITATHDSTILQSANAVCELHDGQVQEPAQLVAVEN